MRNKGIVVKIKDSYCVILAGDGTYHKIPRSRVRNPKVGAESEFSPQNWTNRLKPMLMAACLLVAVLSLNFYRTAASADPAAY
ncbi:MAG TPA: anti-sigma factor domain-containing protein, partial [Desulfobacteria bacterium]|nr:anti-sigma factor domain-containing protein [Desulfobacteria bacterium]